MISVSGLSKIYRTPKGDVHAMDNVDLFVDRGSFHVLLGPSGSGKTTTLRSVAGLEHPDAGEIRIGDATVYSSGSRIDLSPEERPIAMVFQSYALWPHLDVAGNITLPLRHGIRRVGRDEVERRLSYVLDLFNLAEQKDRPISALSGGQQQRVALARAIALEPSVLLMDEPLSNLDAKLRARLRVELKDLTSKIGITTVYVTHDQTEAMVMGDTVSVMNDGAIQQQGVGTDLYQKPANLFVAQFLGDMNFFEGQIREIDGELSKVESKLGSLAVSKPSGRDVKKDVLVGFRPEDATLVSEPGPNVIRGRIAGRHYLGDTYSYQVDCAAGSLQIRSPKSKRLEVNGEVLLELPPDRCLIFEGEQARPQVADMVT